MTKELDVAELSRTLPEQDAVLALLAFGREGDMIKAAKALGVSQPALSFQLKKLEGAVQFPVFSFSGKRKVLTRLGQAYVDELKESYHALHLIHERIHRKARDLDHQKIRVSGRRELFLPFLPFPFPGQIEFIQSSSSDALLALREHRVDLAVSARTVDSSDLVAKLFFESRFKLIYPRSWSLPVGGGEALRNRPVVVYGNHHAYLDDFLAWKDWRFQDLQVSRIVEDWFSVVELVSRGMGWAIIPEDWGIHSKDVLIEDLGDEFIPKQKIFIFHRRDDRKAPWVLLLENWLRGRVQREKN